MKFTSAKPIILASASPRRQELLQMLGVPFTVIPSDVAESQVVENQDFSLFVQNLAVEKAGAVARENLDAIVIGSDTIVVHQGELYPKPESEQQARQFLRELSGATHSVLTGVAVIANDDVFAFSVETKVTFRKLDATWIDAYVASGDPMDKAGAYGIQSAGALFVEKIEGDYYAVMGLPISELTDRLCKASLLTLKDVSL